MTRKPKELAAVVLRGLLAEYCVNCDCESCVHQGIAAAELSEARKALDELTALAVPPLVPSEERR